MTEAKAAIRIDCSRPDGKPLDEFTVCAYDTTTFEDIATIPLRKMIAEMCGECADHPDSRGAYQLAEILTLGAAMARLAASKAEMMEAATAEPQPRLTSAVK